MNTLIIEFTSSFDASKFYYRKCFNDSVCINSEFFQAVSFSVWNFFEDIEEIRQSESSINPKIKKKEDVVDNVIANTFVLYELNLLK